MFTCMLLLHLHLSRPHALFKAQFQEVSVPRPIDSKKMQWCFHSPKQPNCSSYHGHKQITKTNFCRVFESHGPYWNRGQDPVSFPWVILNTSPSALPQNMSYLEEADQGKVQRLSCPLSSMQGNSELISVLEVSMDSEEVIMKNTPPCKSLCPVLLCPSMHAERCEECFLTNTLRVILRICFPGTEAMALGCKYRSI